jgi:hypothetical protein
MAELKPDLRRIEGLARHLKTLWHDPKKDTYVLDEHEFLDKKASAKLNRNRFYMADWVFACGAPACMAGWAVAKYAIPEDRDLSTSRIAANKLGLDRDWASTLFTPNGLNRSLRRITPKQAAAALTRLAKAIRAGKEYLLLDERDVWGKALTDPDKEFCD